MTITIKTRGPAPKGVDLIGLKEAISELLEKNDITVGRIDIQEDIQEDILDDKTRKKIEKLEAENLKLKREFVENMMRGVL